jgi:hypothetical protein
VRALLAGSVAVFVSLTVAACSGDDNSNGNSSQSPIPPIGCSDGGLCTPGNICSGPVEPACNGTWYCWSDQMWHCAPPDSGGPGGAPDGSLPDDADQPAETSPPGDAPSDTPTGS